MPRSLRVIFWLLAAILLLTSSISAVATSGPVHAAAECRVNEDEPIEDDQLASIAKRVPAFGGFYVDGSSLNVWLTDDGESLDAAVQEILSLPGHDDLADLTPVALRARYSFTQLFCWHYREMLRVWINGVIFTDIDDMKNRLTVAVEDLATQGPIVKARLAEVGIRLDAVDIIEEEPVMVYPGRPDQVGPLPAPESNRFAFFGIATGIALAVALCGAYLARRKQRLSHLDEEAVPLAPRGD